MGVTPLRADLDKPLTLRRLAGIGNLILHFAPPQETGLQDKRTRALLAALSTGKILPRRLVYISTSGVYGDCGGLGLRRSVQCIRRRGGARRSMRKSLRRFFLIVVLLFHSARAGICAGDRLPLARESSPTCLSRHRGLKRRFRSNADRLDYCHVHRACVARAEVEQCLSPAMCPSWGNRAA
jgi:hypothetical protein